MLETLADGVRVVPAPLSFLGLRVGTRMTVLRLSDGSVLLHSPVRVDDETQQEIDRIGPVAFIVAPNTYHHLYVADALARWPNARVVAPAALRKKRKDLRIDLHLDDPPPDAWKDDLLPLPVEGSMLRETVLVHRPTRTLVSADLVENFQEMDHAPTRAYLKLGGIYGKPGWHRALRFMYRDRAKAKRSIERILDEPIDRVILAHGAPILDRPKEAVREGLSFLLG